MQITTFLQPCNTSILILKMIKKNSRLFRELIWCLMFQSIDVLRNAAHMCYMLVKAFVNRRA